MTGSVTGEKKRAVFSAATVLFAVLALIFWLSKCVKASYIYDDLNYSLNYTLREICDISGKDGHYVPLLILCVVCAVVTVCFALLQLLAPGKKMQIGGVAAAAAMCAAFAILFIAVLTVYRSMLLGALEGEVRRAIDERVRMTLSPVGIAAAVSSGFCLLSQLLGVFLVPEKK